MSPHFPVKLELKCAKGPEIMKPKPPMSSGVVKMELETETKNERQNE